MESIAYQKTPGCFWAPGLLFVPELRQQPVSRLSYAAGNIRSAFHEGLRGALVGACWSYGIYDWGVDWGVEICWSTVGHILTEYHLGMAQTIP